MNIEMIELISALYDWIPPKGIDYRISLFPARCEVVVSLADGFLNETLFFHDGDAPDVITRVGRAVSRIDHRRDLCLGGPS